MKLVKLTLIFCSSVLLAPLAAAQTQGSLGATSTGQIDLDLEVTDSVEINRLANIDFGSYGGTSTGDLGASEAYCVMSTVATTMPSHPPAPTAQRLMILTSFICLATTALTRSCTPSNSWAPPPEPLRRL